MPTFLNETFPAPSSLASIVLTADLEILDTSTISVMLISLSELPKTLINFSSDFSSLIVNDVNNNFVNNISLRLKVEMIFKFVVTYVNLKKKIS